MKEIKKKISKTYEWRSKKKITTLYIMSFCFFNTYCILNIACDLFATTMLKSLETVLPLELCAQVVIQPRSQGLSSAHPLSGILSSPSPGGRKEENEGNEVECYYLGKNIFKQRGGNLDLPQVDFCLIHRLFISLARSERVISSDVNY